MATPLSNLQPAKTVQWSPSGPVSAQVSGTRALFGSDPYGQPMQILLGRLNPSSSPTKELFAGLYSQFRGKLTVPLAVVLQDAKEQVWIFGPNSEGSVVGPISTSQAERILQAALDEPLGQAATNLLVKYFESLSASAMPGVTNTGLFASHYLRTSASDRPDWPTKSQEADAILPKRGESLIKGLGFTTSQEGTSALILKNGANANRAVAVLLEETESFNQSSKRLVDSPVSFGLALAQAREIPWLIAIRRSQIRLYSARPNEGVGRKGQSETYFEVDMAVVDDNFKALVPLIFSASALSPAGSTEEILTESSKFAVSLGARLRNRIYDRVIPQLSVAVASAMLDRGNALDIHGLDVAYGATLRILFRLLFQAYGEDRALLPYGKNSVYDRHALKTIAKELANDSNASFDANSDSYWRDITNVWTVIDKGDNSWGVPPYDGGLFSTEDEEGQLLAAISIDNSVFASCLRALLVDETEDHAVGPVDFRSLSVREFGTIYEGLLESSLSLAEVDLTLDKNETWVPAKDGDQVKAQSGQPYFHNASGARKATGSYFTPSFLVDHLIEHSLQPALDNHLARVLKALEAGDEPKAARIFFDFRVADLAMGSGHFLISAIDHIEAGMNAFLVGHPIAQVENELQALADSSKEALGDFSPNVELERSSLLRRQIARRCIYGLDINRIAVELSRVAIWIHTFVPGLAMSSLDHGLVHGNSLTGIGTIDEALAELDPGTKKYKGSLFRDAIENLLEKSASLLADVAASSEATASEVHEANLKVAKAKVESSYIRELFDVALGIRLGYVRRGTSFDPESIKKYTSDPQIRDLIQKLRPAHMAYLFPEVFVRERPGFDVLVGNPPWEKIKVEEEGWWGLRYARLRSLSQIEKNRVLKELRATRFDLEAEYQADIKSTDFIRSVISKGPYPGIGSGDIDLYQAFAWRNYQLLRTGGYFGLVLHRGALAGSGTKIWREEILDHASFTSVNLLTNSRKWVFADVHGQYNVGLVCVSKQKSEKVLFNGPFTSKQAFFEGRELFARIDSGTFKSWTSTSAFPWVPNEQCLEVFLQMRKHPRFDAKEGFEFRPVRELDTSINKDLYDFDLANPSGDVRVLTGGSFGIWNPDFGPPYAFAHSAEVFPFLENKLVNQRNNKRSAFYGLTDQQLTPRPWQRPRIAFRNVTNSTNTRTVIACLLPADIVTVEPSPFFLRTTGTNRDDAYLLGILGSRILDWYARRFVELHLTFEILNPMPIPRPAPEDPLRIRVIEIAGRLAAVDGRYSDWASQVGVEVGSVTNAAEKADLIAELDAVVAHLYGLTEKQLVHVFETFHVGWKYQDRLDATLVHFAKWAATR